MTKLKNVHKIVPKKNAKVDRFALLEAALRKLTKADLVALILRTAKAHDAVCRDLDARLNFDKPVDLLLADVAAAIQRATDFDERMHNYNFDVDWQAYEEVKQGFEKLILSGLIDETKTLALELMKRGSYQVECSDEGMMTDDIEACLKPVICAVQAGDSSSAKSWATMMLAADSVGFICHAELAALIDSERK